MPGSGVCRLARVEHQHPAPRPPEHERGAQARRAAAHDQRVEHRRPDLRPRGMRDRGARVPMAVVAARAETGKAPKRAGHRASTAGGSSCAVGLGTQSA